MSASLDCSQYSSDYEILSSFPFITYVNPLVTSTAKTFALMEPDESVSYLNTVNQRYVPLTVFCLKSLK